MADEARTTPRSPSGSHENAVAKIVTLERYAALLDEAATAARWRRLLGRPDLRLRKLARAARELSARFHRWHHPGEWDVARDGFNDRAIDCAEYDAILKEAKACGVSIT